MAKRRTPPPSAPRLVNRKARHRFEILETLECGVMLLGTEVKSLRAGRASLDESYARIEHGELWLIGLHINPYEHALVGAHEPLRRRKLLAKRRQIDKFLPKVTQKGCTLVPLALYFNERGLAKVEIALATGKTGADKRQSLKKREHQREMDRAMRKGR